MRRDWKYMLRIWVLYPLAAAFLVGAHAATRGAGGDLELATWVVVSLGVFYIIVFVASSRRVVTWHSLGHLATYELAAYCGSAFDSHLDEMMGMIPGVIAVGVLIVVFLGFVVNLVAYAITGTRPVRPA